MLEKALSGSKRYWTWIFILLAIIGVAVLTYLRQFSEGLGITGMSRDVSWGLYIGQFTFLGRCCRLGSHACHPLLSP